MPHRASSVSYSNWPVPLVGKEKSLQASCTPRLACKLNFCGADFLQDFFFVDKENTDASLRLRAHHFCLCDTPSITETKSLHRPIAQTATWSVLLYPTLGPASRLVSIMRS